MNDTVGNFPTLDSLDKRLNAVREDLADQRLQDKVKAEKYVAGKPGKIIAPLCNLHKSPDLHSQITHQLLRGEEVLVFEEKNGWAWVQSQRDGYVGYTALQAISFTDNAIVLTHVVNVPMTFCYPKAELREPPLSALSMGSRMVVTGNETVRGTNYALLADGSAIIKKHLSMIADIEDDYVTICENLLHTPYLWGGASGQGLDCSGLVQLTMRMCGKEVLRDSDMQAATIGTPIDPGKNCEKLQRGDLIFWPGHVAIHKGTIHKIPHIIHASGHTMMVSIEPLVEAIERIEYLYEKPIGFRRP